MKLSPKTLVPVLAAFATVAFASPAFAWNSPICNPQTGEVLPGGGAGSLSTETLYFAYLTDHPGSSEMSAGQECTTPTSAPTPTTATPSVVETTLAPLIPVVTHDNRPKMCHYESTVGFSTPRRSNDLFKDLAKPGNTAIDASGQCDKPAAPVVPVAPVPVVVAGVQAVAPPTLVAPPRVPTPVAPSLPAVTAPPAPPVIAAPVVPEIVPVILEISVIAPPAAGDGTQADELAP